MLRLLRSRLRLCSLWAYTSATLDCLTRWNFTFGIVIGDQVWLVSSFRFSKLLVKHVSCDREDPTGKRLSIKGRPFFNYFSPDLLASRFWVSTLSRRQESDEPIVVFFHKLSQCLIASCCVSKPDFLVRFVVSYCRHAPSITDMFFTKTTLKQGLHKGQCASQTTLPWLFCFFGKNSSQKLAQAAMVKSEICPFSDAGWVVRFPTVTSWGSSQSQAETCIKVITGVSGAIAMNPSPIQIVLAVFEVKDFIALSSSVCLKPTDLAVL